LLFTLARDRLVLDENAGERKKEGWTIACSLMRDAPSKKREGGGSGRKGTALPSSPSGGQIGRDRKPREKGRKRAIID